MNIFSSVLLSLFLSSIITYIVYTYNKKENDDENEIIIKNNYQIFIISFLIFSIVFVIINNSHVDMRGGEIELEKALNHIDKGVAPF